MEDTTYQHEQEMKKAGFEDLQSDAETALNNTLDALKKNSDFQQAVIGQMLDNVKMNYDDVYAHLNDVIKEHGLVVTETYKKMFGAAADFNEEAGKFPTADKGVLDQNTDHIYNGNDGTHDIINGAIDRGDDAEDGATVNGSEEEKIQKEIKKWFDSLREATPEEKKRAEKGEKISKLAQHVINEHGKIANRYQFEELAKIVGVETPSAKDWSKWTESKKDEILKKIKNYGFSKGGIVRSFIPVSMDTILGKAIVANNDHGLISARAGETVLTEEFTKMLKPSVEIMKEFVNIPNSLSPTVSNDINVNNAVNVYVDKIANDVDINKLAETVASKIGRNTRIDLKKLR